MLWLAPRLTPWVGLSRERVAPVGSAGTRDVPFVPLKPVSKRASPGGQGLSGGTDSFHTSAQSAKHSPTHNRIRYGVGHPCARCFGVMTLWTAQDGLDSRSSSGQ